MGENKPLQPFVNEEQPNWMGFLLIIGKRAKLGPRWKGILIYNFLI
jgi:hypothetical protein